MRRSAGFSLPEVLVAAAVLIVLTGLSLAPAAESLARQGVETATRRVLLGLDRGRLAAERQGLPCALALEAGGWRLPRSGALAGCPEAAIELGEGVFERGDLQVEHNLPAAVRFSANGLLLDGGTVVVRHPGTTLARCVVVSLPLGVTRVGVHADGTCLPDPAL